MVGQDHGRHTGKRRRGSRRVEIICSKKDITLLIKKRERLTQKTQSTKPQQGHRTLPSLKERRCGGKGGWVRSEKWNGIICGHYSL